jgi:hypothetical protein
MVSLLNRSNELAGLGGLSKEKLGPLMQHSKFFELGAVGPDYPYLSVASGASQEWAEAMHYRHTGDRLKAGIKYVQEMSGPEKEKYKALAWLLGFASHIILDVTIHPVTKLKVGPYKGNEKAHRTCEMHQDVFIYKEMNVGEIYYANFLKDGIATCNDPNHSNRLDPTICEVWGHMLKTADSQLYNGNIPNFDAWHAWFKTLLATASPGKLFAWSRHMAIGDGLLYPAAPDNSYITSLQTPSGGPLPFLEVFRKARTNVREYWAIIARACLSKDEADLPRIRNWNLDTGEDEAGTITFWG